MSDKKVTITIGPAIGFLGITFLLLLTLKLMELATISWFWVFSPLIVIPTIILGGLLLIGTAFGVAKLLDHMGKKRLWKMRKK